MLTVDLVQAFRKGDRLCLRRMSHQVRQRAYTMAQAYLDIAEGHLDQTRKDFDNRCKSIDVHVRDRKLAAGLMKLVLDRCDFEMSADVDPPLLREAVFKEASRQRQAAEQAMGFDRGAVLTAAGKEFSLPDEEVDRLLYADLKSAHRLVSFMSISPAHLVDLYEKSQGQGVLLKATRVTVSVRSRNPGSYRRLFHKLKFLGLLHVIRPLEQGGYRIDIDGPFSMFRSVTKYGLKLALLVPALDECGRWKLDAEVLWGKEKQRLTFHLEGGGDNGTEEDDDAIRPADDVAVLIERFDALETEWMVTPSTEILELSGVGLCIPDLQFIHAKTGEVVYLEVMGFWSRDAVWKRVELVEAGLPQRIIFAVSKRLRVSEQVLPSNLPGSLYVYKGVMSAGRIAELLSEKMVSEVSGHDEKTSF